MNSAVSSLLKKMCYQLNCGYNLITLKVYKYICIFMHFFDKIVYFFHNECADSSEPQREHKFLCVSEHLLIFRAM